MSEGKGVGDTAMRVDQISDPVGAVERTFERFLKVGEGEVVYGQPIEHNGRLLIPASEVLVGLGFGLGSGAGSDVKDGAQEAGGTRTEDQGAGGGGGGGGRTLSRPVAVVVSSESGVRVEPVVDVTKLGMAALTAIGFMAAAWLRFISPRRALRELKNQ